MNEKREADALVRKFIDDADSGDAIQMLSLINANRDTILEIHQKALRKVKKQCKYLVVHLGKFPPSFGKDLHDCAKLAIAIIEAANVFHPMHGESWIGWPDETSTKKGD